MLLELWDFPRSLERRAAGGTTILLAAGAASNPVIRAQAVRRGRRAGPRRGRLKLEAASQRAGPPPVPRGSATPPCATRGRATPGATSARQTRFSPVALPARLARAFPTTTALFQRCTRPRSPELYAGAPSRCSSQ